MTRTRMTVLVVSAITLVVGAGRVQAADAPSAASLESQLVCVTCKTTLDESDSPIARRMKSYIRRRIAEGATGQQIKDELVAQFGKGVLSTPPTEGFDLLAWLLPIAGIVVGAGVLGSLAWAWSRRREPPDGTPGADALDPELERRVDEELARYEA